MTICVSTDSGCQGSGPACPGQHSAALLPQDGRLRAALEERKAMGRKEGKVVQELVMPTLDSHMGAAAKAVSGARALRGGGVWGGGA